MFFELTSLIRYSQSRRKILTPQLCYEFDELAFAFISIFIDNSLLYSFVHSVSINTTESL